jgi:hypothetical protein
MYPNVYIFSFYLVHSTSHIILKSEHLFIYKRLINKNDLCNYEEINGSI